MLPRDRKQEGLRRGAEQEPERAARNGTGETKGLVVQKPREFATGETASRAEGLRRAS